MIQVCRQYALILGACFAIGTLSACALSGGIKNGSTDINHHAQFNVRFELAKSYIAVEQYEQAMKSLDEILDKDDNNVEALHLKAVVLSSMQDHAQAEVFYARALKQDAANVHILNNYGRSLCKQNKISEGLDLLQKAENIADANIYAKVLSNKGICYTAAQNYPEALRYFDSSLKIQSNYLPSQIYQAFVYAQQNNILRAETVLQSIGLDNVNNAELIWIGYQTWRLSGNLISAKLWGNTLVQKYPASIESKMYQRSIVQNQ